MRISVQCHLGGKSARSETSLTCSKPCLPMPRLLHISNPAPSVISRRNLCVKVENRTVYSKKKKIPAPCSALPLNTYYLLTENSSQKCHRLKTHTHEGNLYEWKIYIFSSYNNTVSLKQKYHIFPIVGWTQ